MEAAARGARAEGGFNAGSPARRSQRPGQRLYRVCGCDRPGTFSQLPDHPDRRCRRGCGRKARDALRDCDGPDHGEDRDGTGQLGGQGRGEGQLPGASREAGAWDGHPPGNYLVRAGPHPRALALALRSGQKPRPGFLAHVLRNAIPPGRRASGPSALRRYRYWRYIGFDMQYSRIVPTINLESSTERLWNRNPAPGGRLWTGCFWSRLT